MCMCVYNTAFDERPERLTFVKKQQQQQREESTMAPLMELFVRYPSLAVVRCVEGGCFFFFFFFSVSLDAAALFPFFSLAQWTHVPTLQVFLKTSETNANRPLFLTEQEIQGHRKAS